MPPLGEFLLGVYPPRLLVTAHVHLLLVGFVRMKVMGVATWIFPGEGRSPLSRSEGWGSSRAPPCSS